MVHPTFDYRCKEDPDILLGDEATKVIINATGNRTGLSDEMSAFLNFVLTGKGNSSFTHRLEAAVKSAKTHKEWEVEYMTLYAKIVVHSSVFIKRLSSRHLQIIDTLTL